MTTDIVQHCGNCVHSGAAQYLYCCEDKLEEIARSGTVCSCHGMSRDRVENIILEGQNMDNPHWEWNGEDE